MDVTLGLVAISGVVAVASLFVAFDALLTSRRATAVAEGQAETARDGVRVGRLASVPFLSADTPTLDHRRPRLFVRIRNGGPTVAYGLQVLVEPASVRLEPDVGRRWASSVRPALTVGDGLNLGVQVDELLDESRAWRFPWLLVTVVHHSPLGGEVRSLYEWATAPRVRKWRLRRVRIDPRDGRPPLTFDIGLNLAEADRDDE